MKVIAINALSRAKDADPKHVEPGQIVELTGKELKIALAANAVREPTEDEVLLAEARAAKAEKLAAQEAAEDEADKKTEPKKSTSKTTAPKKAADKDKTPAPDADKDKTPAPNPDATDGNGGGSGEPEITLD